MKLFYTILDALSFLKSEIERLEKRRKKEKDYWKRRELESLMEWNLERGIKIMEFARPGELTREILDFFFDRTKERPDLKKIEELYREDE